MTTAMTTATAHHQAREVVAGVDTHANTHHVAVLSLTGAKLGDLEVTANPAGYRQLVDFVASFGTIRLIGVEGTSSYGAGLARTLTAQRVEFREVIRPRRTQRRQGKSDPLDAYAAAQQALADPASLPVAKTGDGVVEQIRVLLTVRRSALKARVAAIRQIKSLLVTAPDAIKERWEPLTDRELLTPPWPPHAPALPRIPSPRPPGKHSADSHDAINTSAPKSPNLRTTCGPWSTQPLPP
jgi:transposase